MSGFVVSRSGVADGSLLARRGPDRTAKLEAGGYRFTHYLLDTGGAAPEQPMIDGDLVCVFDGWLDRTATAADGGHLLDLYRRHGGAFVRHLEGEFALALYDLGRRELLLATDAFGTKPLFRRGSEAASYRSALGGGERLPPNSVTTVDLDGGRARREVVSPFEFDRQHKRSYDDWIAAFERAVTRRASEDCYLPLSAGYDSGGIDCALRRLGIPHAAYSIAGQENVELLRRRNDSEGILPMDGETFAERRAFLDRAAEAETFRVTIFTGEEEDYEVHTDPASCGLALIHARARAAGRRVFLSGSGADETLAACRHWPGARFPERLEPWPDFDGNWQTAYLAKEEYVAGSLGVEGRYPYLDRRVVQEFLWLSPELKNRFYKAPLHEYMTRHGYPFDPNVKTGFTPLPETG